MIILTKKQKINKQKQKPQAVSIDKAIEMIHNMSLKELYNQFTLNLNKKQELDQQLGITHVLIQEIDTKIKEKLNQTDSNTTKKK